ncbi:MAG: SDR family NAD(P)-dependent oxidoreductase [Candidatus Levyibacteriota bacterium]
MNTQKVALVTGSSQGIGAGIAKILGANQYNVIVTYKSHKEDAEDVVAEIKKTNGNAVLIQLDVTSEVSVKTCMKFIANEFGRLDVLVNNAAVDGLSPLETCTLEKWRLITQTKLDGNFLCAKYALPLLKKLNKSDIIVIMSHLGERVDPDDVAYSVATAGTVSFVKALAFALAKYGVRTNGVGPGGVRTNNGYYREAKLTSDKTWEQFAKDNPLGRVATPEDVGQTVLEVITNKSQFWNGNFVHVSGGEHLSHI